MLLLLSLQHAGGPTAVEFFQHSGDEFDENGARRKAARNLRRKKGMLPAEFPAQIMYVKFEHGGEKSLKISFASTTVEELISTLRDLLLNGWGPGQEGGGLRTS